jgi:hypothetical protein
MPRLWIALASIAAAGCGEEIDPRPASWSYIHPAIVVPNCATIGCHSDTSEQKNLNLESEDEALDDLNEGRLVIPGDPSTSPLILQLQGVGGRLRMPPDAPLPEADVALIQKWIAEGARR